MASIHKQPNRPFWFCSFTTADGRRHLKSTKTRLRSQALVICRKWESAAKKAKVGRLTPDAAREVIAQGVAEIFIGADGSELPRATVREWAKQWMESKALELAGGTLDRYTNIVERFLVNLGSSADKDIEHLTSSQVEAFRNKEAKRTTNSSANLALKVVRAMCASAVAKQLILRNPASASFVKVFDRTAESKRRPLTVSEIKRILAKTELRSEWRGMILMGVYTGQRLGDISRMTWRAIDLESGHIAFTAKKTGRRIILPLAKPLKTYFEDLPSSDDPDTPIFPSANRAAKISTVSNAFYSILQDAGLAEPRSTSHVSTGKGRSVTRKVNALSFHSLRHSAVTMLKAAGASDVLAREIVGHESAAVSRSYTHLATEDLRPAIDNLPDVTK